VECPKPDYAIDGLLKIKLEERWTMRILTKGKKAIMDLQQQPLSTKASMFPHLRPLPDMDTGSEKPLVRRSNVKVPMVAYGMKVCGRLAGKYVGSGPRRSPAECLDLGNVAGILLLYMQRRLNAGGHGFIGCPGASQRLKEGDLIFLARDKSRTPIADFEYPVLDPEQWRSNILSNIESVEPHTSISSGDEKKMFFSSTFSNSTSLISAIPA